MNEFIKQQMTHNEIREITVCKTMVSNRYFQEVAINGIPQLNPLSALYINWWKEQKRRCINGYWVGGRWCPGRLYFHLNFFYIETTVGKSKRKQLALPTPRDIDWEVFTNIELAKGLSGFNENGEPLYENDTKGFMFISARDSGKSVIGSSNICYEFTFFKNNHILVSGYEKKYTQPLLAKAKLGLESIPGSMNYLNDFYPSPFSHALLKTDWEFMVESGKKKRIQGNDIVSGYRSVIHHRVFVDNVMAANGLRVSFHMFEEVGAFANLIDSYNASIPCWRSGADQFGMPYLVGTGGEMSKGSLGAQKMFYNPEAYNLLQFVNDYDKDGSSIAYFLPATRTMMQYKNEEGITTPELYIDAEKFLQNRRDSKKQVDRSTYENELMYYPLEPKEAFLVTNGNIFPRQLLEDQLAFLMSSRYTKNFGQKVRLVEHNQKVSIVLDESLFEVDFPHTEASNKEGCVVIYERPEYDKNNQIPLFKYIIGIDPYDQDKSTESPSLGSCFVYKRFTEPGKTYDVIVAEYTGRPEKAYDFYENCRKLCILYNAKALYENNLKGLKQHFEIKKSLYLLKEQPSDLIRDIIPGSKVERNYGVHMNVEIKKYAILAIKDWLLTEYEPNQYNCRKIPSINLIKELLAYNHEKGNFDRVISFGLCILHNISLYKFNIDNEEVRNVLTDNFKKIFNSAGFNEQQVRLS
jgi:hypothetical protein